MSSYRPSNWYWIVAGSAAQVFSSAASAYVPVGNETYQAWLAAGHKATKILNEAELWEVLAQQYPAGLPVGDAPAQAVYKDHVLNTADLVMMRIAFNHENRVRALEGKAAVTQAQFITAVKALL